MQRGAQYARGGLRTVQCREGMHARLLEQRVKELGGAATTEIPEAIYQATMAGAGSTDTPDAEKLSQFMARFPDIDAALAPIAEMADAGGPTQTSPASATAAAKSAFSDRKP